MPRMTKEQRDKLLVRQAQIAARLQDFEAHEQQQKRKDDTRRKVIYGALALEHAETHPDFAAIMDRLLNRYVTRPMDRKLFDLPPHETDQQEAGETGGNAGAEKLEEGKEEKGGVNQPDG